VVIDRTMEMRPAMPAIYEQVGDLLPRLPVPVEAARRPSRLEHHVLQLRELPPLGERLREWLAMQFLESGLVIEAFELRRSTGHAEMDHPPCLDGPMRRVENPSPTIRGFGRIGHPARRREQRGIEQPGQRDASQAIP